MVEIPDFQTLMLPILIAAADGETTVPKVVEKLGREFNLSPEQMALPLPSGSFPVVNNRAHWAKTYLAKAGLLEQPRRGVFRISQRGREALDRQPARIDIHFLDQYPEFRAFRRKSNNNNASENAPLPASLPAVQAALPAPPNERIAAAAKELEEELKDDLLNRIFQIEPVSLRANFFERMVIPCLSG